LEDLTELDKEVADHRVTGAWPKKYEAVFRAIGQGQKLCNVRHAPTSVYTWQIPEVFGEVSARERLILETIATHRRHKKYGDIPNGNPLPVDEIERLSHIHGIHGEIRSLLQKGYVKEKYGKYDLKGAMFCSGLFKRPKWDEPSPTVLTNFHNPRFFLHPLRDRPFSLRECARLQGFPEDFVFTEGTTAVSLEDGYRLVGNAVPPPVSRELAASVRKLLDACRGKRKGKHEAAARAT
jgi:DNA (cytosine-5)-methyltransferase 1